MTQHHSPCTLHSYPGPAHSRRLTQLAVLYLAVELWGEAEDGLGTADGVTVEAGVVYTAVTRVVDSVRGLSATDNNNYCL